MTKHVYCTLVNSQVYPVYRRTERGDNEIVRKVHIHGGAGIMTKQLVTPIGVHTEISDAEYDDLKDSAVFQDHIKRGHISIRDSHVDVEKVAADMNGQDPSGPITPADYAGADPTKQAVPTSLLDDSASRSKRGRGRNRH